MGACRKQMGFNIQNLMCDDVNHEGNPTPFVPNIGAMQKNHERLLCFLFS